MSLLKTIPDLGATIAWSPVASLPNVLATGTKEGGGGEFSDYGGSLALHRMDLSSSSQQCSVIGRCVGAAGAGLHELLPHTPLLLPCFSLPRSVKTATRFTSLAWGLLSKGAAAAHTSGLLVGGMADGVVTVWDAGAVLSGAWRAGVVCMGVARWQRPCQFRRPLAALTHTRCGPSPLSGAGEQSTIAVIERHQAAVRTLAFNPHASALHLIAAGSADGDISIINLESPSAPTIASCVWGHMRVGWGRCNERTTLTHSTPTRHPPPQAPRIRPEA